MVDSHCHLNSPAFASDIDEVVKRFLKRGGKFIVDITASMEEWDRSLALVEKYPSLVKSAIGIHPEVCIPGTDLEECPEAKMTVEDVRKSLTGFLKRHQKSVSAIGEGGLDYYWIGKNSETDEAQAEEIKEKQREVFNVQCELAQELELPLVVHSREELGKDDANAECLEIVKQYKIPSVVFHSYTGSLGLGRKIIEQKFYLSFNGILTYSGAKDIAEMARIVPDELLLIETDAPLLLPGNVPVGEVKVKKRNEPAFVWYVAKRLAKMREVSIEEILEVTRENAERIFGENGG